MKPITQLTKLRAFVLFLHIIESVQLSSHLEGVFRVGMFTKPKYC